MNLEFAESKKHDCKIYTLHFFNGILYIGDSNKNLVDFSSKKVLFSFKKSVRSITSYKNFLLASSYDCTAALFKNGHFEELVEGPETEIKGCAMNDRYIALATRGCTLWIAKYSYDIETVLEDHTQDIKGCGFFDKQLISWSYDNSIKIYEKLEGIDESFSLIENIELSSTIWKVIKIKDKYIACTGDGEIVIFNEKFKITKRKIVSQFPIYALCKINNFYAISHNLHNLALLDLDCNIVAIKENLCIGINDIAFDRISKIYIGGDCSTISILNIYL